MIGKALKYMRTSGNFSQTDMANLINIKQNTLSRYETETTDINFETIEKIADMCGFKIYFINEKSGEKFKCSDLERKDI